MHAIGTAGHVDHGKTTLITALTGINPDRLKEEQERQMTIDLGFAWLTLPNGEEVGIVDVPGHRDFIANMLAGVGGIDAVLLVIAADEGVMPQTREHLAILDLLQIKSGIVVINKIDLINDPGWLELVESDIRKTLQGTVLQGAEIVRVSSHTKAGFPELLRTLSQLLQNQPPRPDLERPRLPVDRVFSIAGFGTVVTGTLTDGCLSVGDEVEILPSGVRGRIRGLQTHKKKETVAVQGSRTAINISGVDVGDIRRGDVVIYPGQYLPTQRIDVRFRLLPDASAQLHHASQVKFFLGTCETTASVRLLGVDVLQPGEEAWLQLDLRHPVVAVRGDRYILRRPSPGETLGGGAVMETHPKKRYRRFDEANIQRLESLAQGSPAELLLQASLSLGPKPINEVVVHSGLSLQNANTALEEAVASGILVPLEVGDITPASNVLVLASSAWKSLRNQVIQVVDEYHQNFALRNGIPREELKSRLKLTSSVFTAVLKKLAAEGVLTEKETWVARAGHGIRFSPEQQVAIDQLLAKFSASPYAPPSVKECQAEIGEEVFTALAELGDLVTVSTEVVFRKTDYQAMVEKIQQVIQQKGQITLAEVRDLFNTSRRYIQALLEHLDAVGVTVRVGDARKLRK